MDQAIAKTPDANTQLKDILLRENYLTADDLNKAEGEASKLHQGLGEYLVSHGLITRELLGQAWAESFGVPYADLRLHPAQGDQLKRISEQTARQYRLVLFQETPEVAVLATDNPRQPVPDDIRALFPGHSLTVAFAFPEDIENAFAGYRAPLADRFASIMSGGNKVAPQVIDQIFQEALTAQASDIHFEPQEDAVVVRLRIDGVLSEAGRLPREIWENLLNRIKVLAHLRIDEHFSTQDGALRYKLNGNQPIDMRVSIAPTLDGEKVAIRVMTGNIRELGLEDLGLTPKNQDLLAEAAKKPFGMVMVTGPTGSGKTTTLYALIKMLNNPSVNITTIEDPVEYKIKGVNQIQVNAAAHLTFADGLRSIVRQDPNIILVGEVRDNDTAEISVNAALTGHLLMTTFHANDAATAVPRLLDYDIEPFLLSSTLELVIAQRLARRICTACKFSHIVKTGDLAQQFPGIRPFFKDDTITLYRGKGCQVCNNTGYKGRIAIVEVIPISPEMRELILKRPSSRQVEMLARKEGTIGMFEDGISKVKLGITTIDELTRVVPSPQAEKLEDKYGG